MGMAPVEFVAAACRPWNRAFEAGRKVSDPIDVGRPPVLRIRVVEPGRAPRSLSRNAFPTLIGRDRGCEVVLQDPLVSRHHAQIDLEADRGVVIRDLGSSNGTYLAERRIAGTEALSLPARIRLGRTILTLEFDTPATIVAPVPFPASAAPVDAAAAPEPVAVEPVAAAEPVAVEPTIPVMSSSPPGRSSVADPVRNAPKRLSAPTPPLPSPASGSVAQRPPGTTRSIPARLAVIVLLAVAGVAALIATGQFGSRALPVKSTPPSSSVAGAASISVPTSSGVVVAQPSGPPGSAPPATRLKFEITLDGNTIATDTTTTPTACTRAAGAPQSLIIEYSTTFGDTTKFSITVDDTSASLPHLSKADITVEFASLSKTLTLSAADVTSVAVDDNGDSATVTLTSRNARGDSLTGTITCNVIGP